MTKQSEPIQRILRRQACIKRSHKAPDHLVPESDDGDNGLVLNVIR